MAISVLFECDWISSCESPLGHASIAISLVPQDSTRATYVALMLLLLLAVSAIHLFMKLLMHSFYTICDEKVLGDGTSCVLVIVLTLEDYPPLVNSVHLTYQTC